MQLSKCSCIAPIVQMIAVAASSSTSCLSCHPSPTMGASTQVDKREALAHARAETETQQRPAGRERESKPVNPVPGPSVVSLFAIICLGASDANCLQADQSIGGRPCTGSTIALRDLYRPHHLQFQEHAVHMRCRLSHDSALAVSAVVCRLYRSSAGIRALKAATMRRLGKASRSRRLSQMRKARSSPAGSRSSRDLSSCLSLAHLCAPLSVTPWWMRCPPSARYVHLQVHVRISVHVCSCIGPCQCPTQFVIVDLLCPVDVWADALLLGCSRQIGLQPAASLLFSRSAHGRLDDVSSCVLMYPDKSACVSDALRVACRRQRFRPSLWRSLSRPSPAMPAS